VTDAATPGFESSELLQPNQPLLIIACSIAVIIAITVAVIFIRKRRCQETLTGEEHV
jgi:hypothetical protein